MSTRGRITLYATPNEPACGVHDAPYSVAFGPDYAVWFTEVTCGNVAIGRFQSGGYRTYPLPLDVNKNAEYQVFQLQRQIVAGADGQLYFAALHCGMLNGACVQRPSNIQIGRITTGGALRFFGLPQVNACEETYLARGGDGNVWFAFGCTPATVNRPNVASTVGRITPGGVL